mmetsp:Transcript_4551/g.8153  ORF Transcript_4551/g.8153 Transcript_4551/m.8153 type:complete len:104 (-) Transcript_4551:542-853(-)
MRRSYIAQQECHHFSRLNPGAIISSASLQFTSSQRILRTSNDATDLSSNEAFIALNCGQMASRNAGKQLWKHSTAFSQSLERLADDQSCYDLAQVPFGSKGGW